ncbi:MAG: hypothetical protein P4L16_08155 [Chlamydiales bacterium]|nr:hypothetical protein [Chlamydiales bacterium]
MEFQKEYDEVIKLIEDVKKTISSSLSTSSGKEDAAADITVEQMEGMLEHVQGVIDQLNQKANAVAEKVGMTREEMAHFVEDPQNFGTDEWKMIENMQKQIDSFHKTLVQTMLSQENELLVKKERDDQKKNKHFTKRNWIPM